MWHKQPSSSTSTFTLISWVVLEGLRWFTSACLTLTFLDRGKATCGDIDIIVTRPTSDGITHAGECFCLLMIWCHFTRNIDLGLLPELLARLHAAKILTEDLALPDDFSALELCYRGLCKRPEPDAKRRRIDILCVPWENRGAALLYYTVSNSSVCARCYDEFISLQGDDIVSNLNNFCVIDDADMCRYSSIGPWEWRQMFSGILSINEVCMEAWFETPGTDVSRFLKVCPAAAARFASFSMSFKATLLRLRQKKKYLKF